MTQACPSSRAIALVSLVVDDYDRAKSFYCERLGFVCISDEPLPDGQRWVVVSPKGTAATSLLLAKAKNDAERGAIGNQTGGRVGFFLHTDDFAGDLARMRDNGIRFVEEPRDEIYGSVVVFEDLYGNRWDLLQPSG